MKAIVQDRYGPPDVLRLAEIDRPTPGPGEVLVRVLAAAANAADWHMMRGDPYFARLMVPGLTLRKGPKRPVRGRDFAGRVEALGAGVGDVTVGDEVYGEVDDGAFAEYLCVPAKLAGPKPVNLTFEEAAAMPLSGASALAGLRDLGEVGPGTKLLLNGSSGGVGTFAVQIGKVLGAEVTAVCSTRNIDLVRSLGADHVIDYTRQDFTAGPERYDVVLDMVANRRLADLRRALVPGGTLVIGGGGVSEGGSVFGPMGLVIQGMAMARFVSHRLRFLNVKQDREYLATLRGWAESGAIRPVVDRTYALKDVPDAIRYLEGEHARAKVVITL